MQAPPDAQRLEDLEVKVAYLEHQLAELDGLVQELFAANAELRRDLHELRGLAESRDEGSLTFGGGEGPGESGAAGSEKPPHY